LNRRLLIIAILILIALILGCNNSESEKETYKTIGEISNVQTTTGVVEGVRSLYHVTLGNLQAGSKPDLKDQQVLDVSITKDTKFYISKNHKKTKANKEDLRQGKKAEVIWSFANDHLTVINEITFLE
jgi:hypothetical protein